jgi:Fis family transcriptional regulator, factor for inversion stimulation protein
MPSTLFFLADMSSPNSNNHSDSPPNLEDTIRQALDHYFALLGDERPHALHDMVISAIERPLLAYVMNRYAGNVSHASAALGITRNTLRSKLKLHGLADTAPRPLKKGYAPAAAINSPGNSHQHPSHQSIPATAPLGVDHSSLKKS